MKFFTYIKEKSERVKNKNFINFNSKPLWKNLIDKLKSEEVFIDTDSDAVYEECKDITYVNCYKRLQQHIDLEVSNTFKLSPALLMIERFLDSHVFDENELIITPHVTSPFIQLNTIKDACKKLLEPYDSIQACTKHQEFAYYEGSPVNFNPKVIQKTQDLKPIYLSNGAFFIFTKKTFKKHKNRVGSNLLLYEISGKEAVEIDNYEDLELAKLYLNK